MLKRVTEILEIARLQGISQSKIARRLGVNQSSVSRSLGGMAALSSELVVKKNICAMLSVNEDFLSEESDYPFLPSSFAAFRVRGLRARAHPFAWLELLLKYSDSLKVLLLLQEVRQRVEVACVKDDRGSVFLVFIDIPMSWKSFFEYLSKEKLTDRLTAVTRLFFNRSTAGPYQTSSDIVNFNRDNVDSLIEDAFKDILSKDEQQLIQAARKSRLPIKTIIARIDKMTP